MTTIDGKPETPDLETTGSEIEAARLRLVVDRRLGRETPEWVRRVAEAKPKGQEASLAGEG